MGNWYKLLLWILLGQQSTTLQWPGKDNIVFLTINVMIDEQKGLILG